MPRSTPAADSDPTRWELDAEAVAVKIRWFGLAVGYLYANLGSAADPGPLNLILALGLGFTALDTYLSWRGRVVLGGHPLSVSLLEAVFIGLLCHFDGGPESGFRYYYLLSLICAALRHSPAVTGVTCALACLSYGVLVAVSPADRDRFGLVLLPIVLGWVTWAAVALARLPPGPGSGAGRSRGRTARRGPGRPCRRGRARLGDAGPWGRCRAGSPSPGSPRASRPGRRRSGRPPSGGRRSARRRGR